MSVLQSFTLRTLKLNRWRTAITILGIVLSVAMMTAVAGFVTSFVETFRYVERSSGGDWLAAIFDAPAEAQEEPWMLSSFRVRPLGYAVHPHPENERMNKLYLQQYDAAAFRGFHIELMQGRLPLGPDEAVAEMRSGFALGEEVLLRTDDGLGTEEGLLFTIVGTFEGPAYSYHAAFEIILGFDYEADLPCRIYFDTDPLDVRIEARTQRVAEQWPGAYTVVNNSLLRLYDPFGEMAVLYAFSAVLLSIIICGSVMVIYNAFVISVADRSKQIGILRSIGATRRQIRTSIYFEGIFLAALSIPLGVLLGLVVEYVALYLANGLLEGALWGGASLRFAFSWQGIGLAVLLSLFSVTLSAWQPARRMSGMSIIEAIRQNQDIRLSSRQVYTPAWLKRVLGFEAVLALKSMGRYRGKYRATILALVTSIVLFLAVSSFAELMQESTEITFGKTDYNIRMVLRGESLSLGEIMLTLPGVEAGSSVQSMSLPLNVPQDKLSDSARGISLEITNLALKRLDEETFAACCAAWQIEPQSDTVILLNTTGAFSYDERHMRFPLFTYRAGEEITVETEGGTMDFVISAVCEEEPSQVNLNPHPNQMVLVVAPDYPFDFYTGSMELYLQVDDAATYYAQALALIEPTQEVQIFDTQQLAQQARNMNLFVQLFVYGFVVMLSLIGITSVIGVVSTSISLRRQEFAMLQSVGMTPRAFRKMLRLESLLYGVQSLLLGIPLGLAARYWLYLVMQSEFEYPYSTPWTQLAICTATVFAVVFITMTYAGRRAIRDNIIDTLRQESI